MTTSATTTATTGSSYSNEDILMALVMFVYIFYLQKGHIKTKNEELYNFLNQEWILYLAVMFFLYRTLNKVWIATLLTIIMYVMREMILNKSSRWTILEKNTYDYTTPIIDENFD